MVSTSGGPRRYAPVAGKAMAALIEDREAGNNHDACLLRHRLEHLEHAIDMATVSRPREVNRNSPFPVLE